MDSDIQIPIRNKHTDHKKNLQKEIQPQVPLHNLKLCNGGGHLASAWI